jgi:hypothetical protein
MWYRPPAATPDLVRMISRPLPARGRAGKAVDLCRVTCPRDDAVQAPSDKGGRHASISVPSDDGVGTPDLVRIDFGALPTGSA